jgi:hypothetical protein
MKLCSRRPAGTTSQQRSTFPASGDHEKPSLPHSDPTTLIRLSVAVPRPDMDRPTGLSGQRADLQAQQVPGCSMSRRNGPASGFPAGQSAPEGAGHSCQERRSDDGQTILTAHVRESGLCPDLEIFGAPLYGIEP